ncbi:MAG: hypothetical protein AAGI24_00270 [Pseudomonadota bacterium]
MTDSANTISYASVATARATPGLRLVVSEGVPGPWGEAIKSVLAYKKLDYLLAGQEVGGDNLELVSWTGQASAPVLAWDDLPPCTACVDQVLLAEQLAPDPALLPRDPGLRSEALGILFEMAGRYGVGWQRRLQITQAVLASGQAPPMMQTMAARYGYSEEAAASAPAEIASRLDWLAERLGQQKQHKSRYLVGQALTAADLYVANFIGVLSPLPHELNPMPAPMRASYSLPGPTVPGELLSFRDFVYAEHIETPLTF